MAWLGVTVSTIATVSDAPPETSSGWSQRREALARSSAAAAWNKFLPTDLVTKLDVAQAFVDKCIAARVSGD
jgi:long-chain-acyl-CoA dehydrogenase